MTTGQSEHFLYLMPNLAGNAGDKFTLNMFNGSIIVSPGAILDYETPQINLTFVVGAYNPTTPLLMVCYFRQYSCDG